MAAIIRGNSLLQSLKLFYLSVTIVALSLGQQVSAQVTTKEGAATTNEGNTPLELSPVTEPKLPPLGSPSLYLPIEEASPTSTLTDTQLVIKLSDRKVYVYRDKQVKGSYPIAVGKAGWETPTGTFKVIAMQRNPSWEHPWSGKVIPPGADNPLGARWIGFWTDGKNFIGFHGTPQEQLVGQAVSHGCIRMRNKDILALYAQVAIGTPVVVER
ncbi:MULTISPECIES: L,D-transpeptidase [Cyanophyceae]|uniref:L,D-transpeptidase n=1 Tax=Cyanophyceae TaxID=3028117 RepID=UPI001688FF5B|nr:L,D-transpeptidase [Trichocoleus sp. FACHB-40]MBD2004610.1 L,D-transpeptidase [Trichocoleus sp. FACHB-40]